MQSANGRNAEAMRDRLYKTPTVTWPRLERIERRQKKRMLRNKGVKVAKRQWVTCVQTTAIHIPQWAIDRASKYFSTGPHHVWFRGRSSVHAKQLAFDDREAGGEPELSKIEWRLCPVCRRPLLSLEAEARRRMDESGRFGRLMPCAGECK